MFGRGGEEAEYLKSHKIKYEIIPGITSGSGSATYSGIPLTHRSLSSSVVFVTGHEDPSKRTESIRWKRMAKACDTIVIMMGLARIGVICKQLLSGGIDKNTPVAVIQDGTTARHKMIGDCFKHCSSNYESTCIPNLFLVKPYHQRYHQKIFQQNYRRI